MTDLSFILQEVSERTGISVADIKGRSRKREIVTARHAYCYIARKATRASLSQISRELGRDHSTAINSIDFVTDQLSMPIAARPWLWCKEVAHTYKTLNERARPTTLIGREIIKAHEYFMANDYDHCIRSLRCVIAALEPNLELEALAADQKMFEHENL